MISFIDFRSLFCIFLLSAMACAGDTSSVTDHKGTITPEPSSKHKTYNLKDGNNGYQINNCGDFQDGEVVHYRVKEDKVYVRRDDGKEFKCTIEASLGINNAVPTPSTFHKGTILGYDIRYRTSNGVGGVRRAKVYDLRGPDLIYAIDFCGSFQAGEFTAGQVVEYRVDGEKVYVRHDINKEYECQLEGTFKPGDTPPAEAAQPASPAGMECASTARIFITSIPDGADIEVDSNFSGNTPSDLEVADGERTITVKKSGYKDWERKVKVVAGSNIHLNAEMEKATNR